MCYHYREFYATLHIPYAFRYSSAGFERPKKLGGVVVGAAEHEAHE